MPEENLRVNLVADDKKLKQGLDDGKKQLQDFGKTVTQIGGLIGAAFGTRELIRFTSEAVKMAGVAQGVRAAFERLGDPGLLDRLRSATQGMVSDLILMQKAVQASNFKIPMDVLAKGLEFATRRAKETGEEVDYLVQSFVTGVGRKSAMVLDNLGISLVELQEEIKVTGDFMTATGNIIDREMSKAGETTLTTADRFAQVKTNADNLQESLGATVIEVWEVDEALDNLNETIKSLTDSDSMPLFVKYIKEVYDWHMMLIWPIRQVKKELDLEKGAIKAWIDENTLLFKNLDFLFGTDLHMKGTATPESIGYPTPETLGKPPEAGPGPTQDELLEAFKKRSAALKQEAELAGLTEKAWKEYMDNIMNYSPVTTSVVVQNFSALLEAEENVIDGTDELVAKWREGMDAMEIASIEMSQVIHQAFVDLGAGVGEALGNLFTQSGNIMMGIASMIARLAKMIGRVMIAIGTGMFFIPGLQGNAAGLIAGGIALTAAGQIGQNLINQAQSNPSANMGSSSAGQYINVGGTFRLAGRDFVAGVERNTILKYAIT